ncbi:glycosyltransferase [Vreelandella alkaliphila]|uniref:glycosyltransferase n=1 Tax=Vreelandella alkaliphila TaxID=272774 RepID=UPI003FD86C25
MKSISENEINFIKKSGFFDPDWYLNTYPDVKKLGMDPCYHYLKYGGVLERKPNPLIDVSGYAEKNGKGGGKEHPFYHYIKDIESGACSRNLLYDAYALSFKTGIEYAVKCAQKISNAHEASALNCLLANAYLDKEEEWVRLVNVHLSSFGILPIELKDGPGSVFSRITAKPKNVIKDGPLVSIIMPAFNAEDVIGHSIESLLNQTWWNIEIIVVDDCSQDKTLDIIRSYALKDPRVKVLSNSINMGPYVSKNRALSLVEGEYITGHDADDWAHPQRIENHVRKVLENKGLYKATATKMIRMTESGEMQRFSKLTENTVDGITQTAFISTMFEFRFFKQYIGAWDCIRFGADSEVINRCRTIAPEKFHIFDMVGMLCLDSDTGLTAHPEFGTRGAMSPVRKKYKRAFLKWHETCKDKKVLNKLKMPFPYKNRKFSAPSEAVVNSELVIENIEHANSLRKYIVDVCIVTDLRFPGGNASTTITEVEKLLKEGKSVRLIHLPSKVSERKPISKKYMHLLDCIDLEHYSLSLVQCKRLIVRHPGTVLSKYFKNVVKKINAEKTAVIVNNSIYRADGSFAYEPDDFLDTIKSSLDKNVLIYPLSPVIRDEISALATAKGMGVGTFDWTPVFSEKEFPMRKLRTRDDGVIRIGKHGRDQVDKWPDDIELLKQAYPSQKGIEVNILGGIDALKKKLGIRPVDWKVYAFGELEPNVFLHKLDYFVYFPSTNLNEAFGRVVVEALYKGLPCILPLRFKKIFGDLCFYCNENEVFEKIVELEKNWLDLEKHCERARLKAVDLYGVDVLIGRFDI